MIKPAGEPPAGAIFYTTIYIDSPIEHFDANIDVGKRERITGTQNVVHIFTPIPVSSRFFFFADPARVEIISKINKLLITARLHLLQMRHLFRAYGIVKEA
jgi:hypothetical protein